MKPCGVAFPIGLDKVRQSLTNPAYTSHISTMTEHPRRKPLRERVAARKAGLPEEEGVAPAAPWRKWVRWAGMTMQLVAFVLLIIELFSLLEAGFIGLNEGRLVAYLIVFFAGRVMQMIASFTKG